MKIGIASWVFILGFLIRYGKDVKDDVHNY